MHYVPYAGIIYVVGQSDPEIVARSCTAPKKRNNKTNTLRKIQRTLCGA